MKIVVDSDDFRKLLQYPDSVAIEVENDILTATSKLKGLETMVAFRVKTDTKGKEFFAVTMTQPTSFFKIAHSDITLDLKEASMTVSAGMMTVEIPITRDILSDFKIPPFDQEGCMVVDNSTRFSVRSMLSTMAEVSKAILDYSGTTIRIHKRVAALINNSMCLECEAHLPDMSVSASAMLSMLSLTNNAETLMFLPGKEFATFATEDIIIRIPLVADAGEFICSDTLMSRCGAEQISTKVEKLGLSSTLKALSAFRDATSAALIYNETGMEFSMRGNGYSVTPSIKGSTIFINPRVLIVLGKFLCADSYTITKGDKYICLSTNDRKLTIYATNF